MSTEWTDAEREAVRDEIAGAHVGTGYYGTNVGMDDARDIALDVLDALAPHIAAREAAAERRGAVMALRDAADAIDLSQHYPSALITECRNAEAAAETWLRIRAEQEGTP